MPYGLKRRRKVAFESRHEKTCFLQMRKQRRGNRAADQRLWFRCIDSKIHLLPKTDISIIYSSSVVVQTGLFRTLSENPKTGFFHDAAHVFYITVTSP